MTPRFVISMLWDIIAPHGTLQKMLVPFLQCAKFKIEVEIMNMHLVGNIKSACWGLHNS
jgi:hypothetical protein